MFEAQFCSSLFCCCVSLTPWEPVYNIFVPGVEIALQPAVFSCFVNAIAPLPIELESCSNPQKIRQVFLSAMRKKLVGNCGFFVSDVISEVVFWAILAHVIWPRAQLLDQSISLKFLLETRFESKSFKPLSNFLAFLVQKLWSKINKIII